MRRARGAEADVLHRGSASDALREVITGPPRAAVVVGAGRHAVYLRAGRHGTADSVDTADTADTADTVALVSAPAVRVPCAVVLAPGTAVPVPLGAVLVGDGGVRWAGGGVRVVSWWRAAQVRAGSLSADAVGALRARLRGHRLPDGVSATLRAAAPGMDADLLTGVLGLGAGLTPSADDAVAGMLLLHRALHGPSDAAALVEAAQRRTTAVSASLLAHAAEGRAAPPVVAAVEALVGRGPVQHALDALWALGATSGSDTAAGMLVTAGAHQRVPA